jgi:3-keto-disaccharide hydrolase
MIVRKYLALLCLAVMSTPSLSAPGSHRTTPANDKIIGRWDMTVHAENSQYPSWFEVTDNAGQWAGRFVGRVGSQRPIKTIEFANGKLSFSLPVQYERHKTDLKFEGNLVGARLEGTTFDPNGAPLKWTAVRAAKLDRRSAPRWGKSISLFNGSDLTGWKLRDGRRSGTWRVVDGIMESTPRGTDLITEQKFADFKLHIEFKTVEKGNSGVYLRGRYEVQIEDSFGQEPESHRLGGVYGFITPSSNPAKTASEWQSFDITLIGRRVTVFLNDKKIIDNAEIPGITGGALDSDEGVPGPIMLQGDHEKVFYRNIVLTPAN